MSPSCLLAALFLVGVAQAQLIEWTVDDYPNPMVEPMKCGRPKGKMTKVCDPNGILSKKDADVLDHILLTLPNDTQCPCSAYSCERRGGGTGFHMAVAIVRKMKRNKGIPKTRDATEAMAGQFALKLQKTKWKSGVCDESVVIFFSKEDGVVTMTTMKAWMSLNFKQNQPQTLELTALEHFKKPHRLTMKDLL